MIGLLDPCERAAAVPRRWATVPKEPPFKVDELVLDATDPTQVLHSARHSRCEVETALCRSRVACSLLF